MNRRSRQQRDLTSDRSSNQIDSSDLMFFRGGTGTADNEGRSDREGLIFIKRRRRQI